MTQTQTQPQQNKTNKTNEQNKSYAKNKKTIILNTTNVLNKTQLIGPNRFLINARYITTSDIQVDIGEENLYTIKNKTILIVNRFENNIPILRWMAFDLKKFIETKVNEEISVNLKNFVS